MNTRSVPIFGQGSRRSRSRNILLHLEYAPENKEERFLEIEIHNMHDISFRLRQCACDAVLVAHNNGSAFSKCAPLNPAILLNKH